MPFVFFSLLFFGSALYGEEQIQYRLNAPQPIEASFSVSITQKVEGHEVTSSLEGGFGATLELVGKGEVTHSLPTRIALTFISFQGGCEAAEGHIFYSSLPKKGEKRGVLSPYERAAASLVGKPLHFKIEIDEMAGSLSFQDEGELTTLVKQNPFIAEICPKEMLEALLQQVLAPAFKRNEQWQRLAATITVPVTYQWKTEQEGLTAKVESDLASARLLLSKPLTGRFSGSGRWNPSNGLDFQSEREVDYTAQLEGGRNHALSVTANWLIRSVQ